MTGSRSGLRSGFFAGFHALIGPLVIRPALKDRLRFLLTISGIAVGVATIAAIRLANASVLSSFSDTVDFVAGKSGITILADGPGIPEATLLRLAWVRRAGATLAPAITETAATGARDGEVVEVLGIDPLADAAAREYSFADEGEKEEKREDFFEGITGRERTAASNSRGAAAPRRS